MEDCLHIFGIANLDTAPDEQTGCATDEQAGGTGQQTNQRSDGTARDRSPIGGLGRLLREMPAAVRASLHHGRGPQLDVTGFGQTG